ncbi:hypothetical protein [Marispirochaeta aestuarii]|uniref:hypothetical protein n=1 Tax=Marispirochaeta aestuarii TaxID=1963862 RepID=UPI0029C698EB|nr:hypothetical protein [Marispirochaeta aestuarii]
MCRVKDDDFFGADPVQIVRECLDSNIGIMNYDGCLLPAIEPYLSMFMAHGASIVVEFWPSFFAQFFDQTSLYDRFLDDSLLETDYYLIAEILEVLV